MKTKILVVILMVCLLLVACSTTGQGSNARAAVAQGTPAAGKTDASTNSAQPPVPEGSQGEMPVTMKLALGTFKLDETDYPISADQAKELLPLWKALRTLSQSETAASQEIEAVQRQLQSTMTAQQLKAIDEMDLTFQDMRTIAEKLGLDLGFGNMSPELRETAQAARQSGQAPPGGPGGEFFGPPGGGPGGQSGSNQEARQTAIAQFSNQRDGNVGVNPALLDAIIEFLAAKVK